MFLGSIVYIFMNTHYSISYPSQIQENTIAQGTIFLMLYFIFQVEYICTIHIHDVLKDISESLLIELPDDHASSVQHLIELHEVRTMMTIFILQRNFFFF